MRFSRPLVALVARSSAHDLGGIKAGPQQLAFLEKYGFTASAAYSVIEGYALKGKLTSSVDIEDERLSLPLRDWRRCKILENWCEE
ncbi:hypothetical protein NKI46_02560 [Mesorhizobium sp. M0615]|uniref:hypothetical protein n=1 Tax=Mesorhizobium sp. M0615 TaxID=2956971 RepID=UPI00333A72E4